MDVVVVCAFVTRAPSTVRYSRPVELIDAGITPPAAIMVRVMVRLSVLVEEALVLYMKQYAKLVVHGAPTARARSGVAMDQQASFFQPLRPLGYSDARPASPVA